MMVIGESVRTLRRQLVRIASEERGRRLLMLGGAFVGGFFLAAAALAGHCQPLALGLLCASPPGFLAVMTAIGGSLGYLTFWGRAGIQGVVWMAVGLAMVAAVGDRPIERRQIFLMPALAAVAVSGCGVYFLLRWGDSTPVPVYLLRVAAGAGTALIFRLRRDPGGAVTDWLAGAIGVLALAQVVPFRYLGLGYVAAGFLGASGAFPAAVLAGLALDLAQVTRVRMTGVLCLGFCLRLIPRQPKWTAMLAPAVAFVPVAVLGGVWDVLPLPGLLAGGLATVFLPNALAQSPRVHRRGETAVAQVRLEQMALALRQMEQTLALTAEPGLDRGAVLLRAVRSACDACPERRQCKGRREAENLDGQLLEQPGLGTEDLPEGCKKPARLLMELRRGQEQLRRMKGQRSHLTDCRGAVGEQYGFLADYLEALADDLSRRPEYHCPRFRPEVAMSTRSCGEVNGDLCSWFPGTGNQYFVLLCDGMGTGEAAARESREAVQLLRQMLSVGFPAEYALRSLNSLCLLREFPGCATVDLAQIQLDTGRTRVYKWGAAPSYLLAAGQFRRIGTASPPPGWSQQSRERVDRLSLGGGEVLILLSDGAGEEALLQKNWSSPPAAPGEMAAQILEGGGAGEDDATAVVIRLVPEELSTQ